eukprot:c302_g1_i2.p1 GENE.c302_g1_i2~~c302_g1_i2.p1  ORF type:complete len:149 (+),score=44.42 c302_g1_i2:42-449(+)
MKYVLLFILSSCMFSLVKSDSFCLNSLAHTDCKNYDKACVKEVDGNEKTICLKCSPSWFLECDCSRCTAGFTPGGIGVISASVIVSFIVIIVGVIYCCTHWSGCPVYERRRTMQSNQPDLRESLTQNSNYYQVEE